MLHPPARVQEAFTEFLKSNDVTRSRYGESHHKWYTGYSLSWDFLTKRWGILSYRFDRESNWVAYPICAAAKQRQ